MFLYLVEVRATGKRYIAAASVSTSRYRHRLDTDARRRPSPLGTLFGDISLYGIEAVRVTLLEECDDNVWEERRRFFVSYFDTMRPHGYNFQRYDDEYRTGLGGADDEEVDPWSGLLI